MFVLAYVCIIAVGQVTLPLYDTPQLIIECRFDVLVDHAGGAYASS